MLKRIFESKILLYLIDIFFFLETLWFVFVTGMDNGGLGSDIPFFFTFGGMVLCTQLLMIISQLKFVDKRILIIISIINIVIITAAAIFDAIKYSYYGNFVMYLVSIIISIYFIIRFFILDYQIRYK